MATERLSKKQRRNKMRDQRLVRMGVGVPGFNLGPSKLKDRRRNFGKIHLSRFQL